MMTEAKQPPNIPADAAVTTNGYDADIPDAELDAPITLTMSPFTVPPNSEVFKCQQFGNPWGHDVDIVKMDGYMDAGSHHFFLFNMDATTLRTQTAPIGDCPGAEIEFHPFPYLSQTKGHYIVTYPDATMGHAIVAARSRLMMNAHYACTGTTALSPTVSITIYPAKLDVVTTHVGSIFLNNTAFSGPKGHHDPHLVPKDADAHHVRGLHALHGLESHAQVRHGLPGVDGAGTTQGFYGGDELGRTDSLQTTENSTMHMLPLKMEGGIVDHLAVSVHEPDLDGHAVRRLCADERDVPSTSVDTTQRTRRPRAIRTSSASSASAVRPKNQLAGFPRRERR